MPIQLTYAQKDGKPVAVWKECTLEEWTQLKELAFDGKPEKLIEGMSEEQTRLLTAD